MPQIRKNGRESMAVFERSGLGEWFGRGKAQKAVKPILGAHESRIALHSSDSKRPRCALAPEQPTADGDESGHTSEKAGHEPTKEQQHTALLALSALHQALVLLAAFLKLLHRLHMIF
jgi:hypothetical protein